MLQPGVKPNNNRLFLQGVFTFLFQGKFCNNNICNNNISDGSSGRVISIFVASQFLYYQPASQLLILKTIACLALSVNPEIKPLEKP